MCSKSRKLQTVAVVIVVEVINNKKNSVESWKHTKISTEPFTYDKIK